MIRVLVVSASDSVRFFRHDVLRRTVMLEACQLVDLRQATLHAELEVQRDGGRLIESADADRDMLVVFVPVLSRKLAARNRMRPH